MKVEKKYTIYYAGKTLSIDDIKKARELLQELGGTAYIQYEDGAIKEFTPAVKSTEPMASC